MSHANWIREASVTLDQRVKPYETRPLLPAVVGREFARQLCGAVFLLLVSHLKLQHGIGVGASQLFRPPSKKPVAVACELY